MAYTIGLTGSIGSGKSTVSKIIKEQGIEIIDADEISRGLTSKGSPIVSELVEAFGEGILDIEGQLDRRKLAEVAFSHEDNREKLSEIVTLKVVAIIEDIREDIINCEGRIVVFDIPLLFEYGLNNKFDEIWTVVADTETRFLRAHLRDGISKEDFDKRDASQVSQLEKIAISDIVIYNDKELSDLIDKVKAEVNRVKLLSE